MSKQKRIKQQACAAIFCLGVILAGLHEIGCQGTQLGFVEHAKTHAQPISHSVAKIVISGQIVVIKS